MSFFRHTRHPDSQVEVAENETGLDLAPFDPKEWVASGEGDSDDSPEERSVLGKGAFGLTLRMSTRTGVLVAAKRVVRKDLRKSGMTDENVRNEAQTLGQLRHQHVIRYLGIVTTKKHLLLVMELAAGGSLADQVPRQRSADVIAAWARQIASALGYVHWRRFVHRDVKAANVLLSAEGDVRLADFGLTCFLESTAATHFSKGAGGTSTYFSPERGQGRSYGPMADMWSAGCLLIELLDGKLLTKPIWHDGPEVTQKREELLSRASDRCTLTRIMQLLALR